jgi:hypothetical protein
VNGANGLNALFKVVAFDKINGSLIDDELVCIFPKGELTGASETKTFKSAISEIVERDSVHLVPEDCSHLSRWLQFLSYPPDFAIDVDR